MQDSVHGSQTRFEQADLARRRLLATLANGYQTCASSGESRVGINANKSRSRAHHRYDNAGANSTVVKYGCVEAWRRGYSPAVSTVAQ